MSDAPQSIKVRLNAAGKRLIGVVDLPENCHRIADVLNRPAPYLLVRDRDAEGFTTNAIRTDAISYVEPIEEVERPVSLRQTGGFVSVTVELDQPSVTMLGEVFVPENGSLQAVLDDDRRFLGLRLVRFLRSVEQYGYLAVGTRHIISVLTYRPDPAA